MENFEGIMRKKLLIKRRMPEGDIRKRTYIGISIYKVVYFLRFNLSFCFDYINYCICLEVLR